MLPESLAECGFPPLDNSFARLPEAFYTRLLPEPLPAPYLVAVSTPVAALLGLPETLLADRQAMAECFAGNCLLPGSEPLAAVYSGHQFGVWAGQLGDGRAHLLGGLRNPHGHWEIQLKGAGQTPYSRRADGRAVLRSSIREFLCSEAMAGLGIPTTRALCLVGADVPVYRETVETAAVVTRVAPGFVRFGSFEHWAARGRADLVQRLADYVIDTFRPECRAAENPYAALLADVCKRTAHLMAQWMAVGFMHGVMNTDNMSILGLTLDYGPFGFMEAFDRGHICNHSDEFGRYSYENQPLIAEWNLQRLARALTPRFATPEAAMTIVKTHFQPTYEAEFTRLMLAKLGLPEVTSATASQARLIRSTFYLLQQQHTDYTLFFRRLSQLAAVATTPQADAPLLDLLIDRAAGAAWLTEWRQALEASTVQDDIPRQTRMQAINPKYVLRNWLAEQAIRHAQNKDFGEIDRLLTCLRQPFAEQTEFEHYAALPPDWASGLEVSCSS